MVPEAPLEAVHAPRRRARLGLLALLALFIGPLVAATVWYAVVDEFRPSGHVNHGVLLTPMAVLEAIDLQRADGSALPVDWLRGHWSFVQVGGSRCDLDCEASLFKTRQAHAMLGRDAERVQRLYVLTEAAEHELQPLLREHPDLEVASGTPAQLQPVLDALPVRTSGTIYLIDPIGNVMMRYDAAATTKGLVKDLKRLLKVSKIG